MVPRQALLTFLCAVICGGFLSACAGSGGHHVVIPDPDGRWRSVEIVSTEFVTESGAGQLERTASGEWRGQLAPGHGAQRATYRLRAVAQDGTSLFFPDPNNRIYTVTPDGVVLSVWLGNIEELATFEYFAHFQPTARQVFLSGDFVGWHEDRLLMLPVSDGPTGLFEAYVDLQRPFSYKIIVDGLWVLENANPGAQTIVSDNLGGGNNSRDVENPPRQTFLRRQLQHLAGATASNAMTVYAHIDLPYPTAPLDGAERELGRYLATGETDMPNLIRDYMDLYNAPIQLVRDGARMKAHDRFAYSSIHEPSPEPLAFTQTARVMAAGALHRASEGYPESAVEDLIALMHMGFVLQQEDSSVLQHLVGTAIRQTAAETMRVLLEKYSMPPAQLQTYVDEVAKLDPRNAALHRALLNELTVAENSLLAAIHSTHLDTEGLEDEMQSAGFSERAIRDSLQPANVRADFEGLRAMFLGMEKMGARKRYEKGPDLKAELELMISELNPMIQMTVPDYLGAEAAQDVARSLEHMNATAALLLLKKDKALTRFLDPFTDQPFEHYPTAASPFRLRSPGPDLVIEKGVMAYDRAAGVFSSGDLYFGQPR